MEILKTMPMRFHLLILNISLAIGQTTAQGLYEKNTTSKSVEIFFVRSLAVDCQLRNLRLRIENKSGLRIKKHKSIKKRKKMPNSKTSDMQKARNLEPGYYDEYNSCISETIQDQSMTLQEILERFKRGQSLPVGREVYYDGEGDELLNISPDPTLDGSFDLVDADNLREQLNEAKAQRQSANGAKRRSAESQAVAAKAVTERSEVEAQGENSQAANAEVLGENKELF